MTQLSIKQEAVLDIIREHKRISQPDIMMKMLEAGHYKDGEGNVKKATARSGVSKTLTQLTAKGIIKLLETERSIDGGGIEKNIWGLN